MFEKFSLRTKLLCLSGALLASTIIVGGVSFWGINKMDNGLNKIARTSLPNIKQADNMYLYYSKVRIALRTLGLPDISKAEQDAAVATVLQMIANYEESNKNYQSHPFSAGEKEIYDQVEKDWEEFKKIGTKVLSLQKNGTAEDKKQMLKIFLVDCPQAAEKYNKSILTLVDFHEKNAAAWASQALNDASFVKNLQNFIMAFGVLAGLIVGYVFARSISVLLHDISDRLAKGSDKIATITGEISAASTNLSSSITQQAAALQQTTSAVEQTSASVVSNADNAKKSSEVSEHSKDSVHNGKKAVEEVIASIDQIADSIVGIKNEIDESNNEIAGIVHIIKEIEVKTKVINDIVFQTKLLSFNASVEAARAGEYGKGFAVVAEEIGNLATMSGKSAKEITELLTSSTEKVQTTIMNSKSRIGSLMDQSREKVEIGTLTANKCSVALDEITHNVSNVDTMISEISSASNEQSLSIREITKAMSEIDSASHQNSSSSHQAKEASEQLENQIEDFRGLVIRLNTFIEGKKCA